VEKTAFEINPTATAPEKPAANSTQGCGQHRGRGQGRGQGQGRGARGRGGKRGASYTVLHGQKCGARTGVHDAVTIRDEPPLSDEAPVEGLFVFIQTTVCRQKVLEKVFENAPSSMSPVLMSLFITNDILQMSRLLSVVICATRAY
jgi:hypothetical protein